jgi:hypothetical protein
MMNQEDIYQAEQDYARYTDLMFNKEILTQEEYEFCFNWDHEMTRLSTSKIGENCYLNFNVYSEADKEEADLRREQGI